MIEKPAYTLEYHRGKLVAHVKTDQPGQVQTTRQKYTLTEPRQTKYERLLDQFIRAAAWQWQKYGGFSADEDGNIHATDTRG